MAAPEEWQRVPSPRRPADDRAAWFSYTATGDRIMWSAALRSMLGDPPAHDEVSRKILARYVHRDDHAEALSAITKAWTTGAQVRTTIRLMRADGGWFDVDCRLDPVKSPDGTVRGIRGTVTDVSARERARRESDRLARRGETVQASLVEPDPATGLLTRARFADEIDRELRRGGGAVLVVRVQPESGSRPERNADLLHRAARVLEGLLETGALLGRVGPNEIALLLAGTSWPMARREAELLVQALRSQTFVLTDTWLRAEAWGGLVRFTPDGDAGSHDLLIDAEQAWRQSRDNDRPLTHVAHPVPAR